ncbi:enoyl-CoA hydratase family protein [Streptomyces sp. G45]|uniref:enoyl-CoA hydratase family protein n=1 Tax=Streptomyces sp. G45 TaxID=3406627 RepID=UPI003C1A2B1F
MAVVSVAAPERGIATLTLDSPANRNALSKALVGELAAALADAAADDTVRALVLTHTGTAFCAGADLRQPPDPADFVALLRQVLALPKPVVARVRGHVRAGGLGLLAACDIAVADAGAATFALTEVHLGLVPAVISLTLLPRLDPAAAARYHLTGERFDAAEAARIGLVTAYADDVDAALTPVLDGLRKAAPGALADTKRLLTAKVLTAFDHDADAVTSLIDLSERRFGSAEAREGMTAFLERRERPWVL